MGGQRVKKDAGAETTRVGGERGGGRRETEAEMGEAERKKRKVMEEGGRASRPRLLD